MDFGYLLRILTRRKWLIAAVMLLAACATFLFIGRKPERYKATVLLSTGIVNYKGINSDNSDAFVQQYQVENAFSNLIEFAQSRSTVKLLTIQMLQHDLNSSEKPYRQPNLKLARFEQGVEDQQLLQELAQIKLDSINDPSFSQQFDYLLDKIARAYGYDNDALRRSIAVKRKGDTDLLAIEVISETPQLSRYMANTYVARFMLYYQNLSEREKRKNVDFYTKLAREKKAVVDSIQNIKYAYLYQRGLPALGKQSEELVKQLGDLEMMRQQAEAKRNASEEQVGRIQQFIETRSARDAGETKERVIDKNNTADLRQRVQDLTEKSVKAGGKDPVVEAELAGAKVALEQSVRSLAGTIGKPKQQEETRRTKEELYRQQVSADLERIDAEKSIARVNSEIGTLRSKLSAYVANDEFASSLEAEQKRAEDEFDKVNAELITAKLALENIESPLHVVENAQLPEWPEPNRQILLSVFASIVAGTLTIIALFLLAYFDSSLQTPELFKKFSGLSLLGAVGAVPVRGLDFKTVFSNNSNTRQFTAFRESLRKIRTLLLQGKDRIFLFTSTQSGEGKTFSMYALAHSLAANHKRVVLVDTNFKTPLPPDFTEQASANTEQLNALIREYGFADVFRLKTAADAAADPRIDLIGNRGFDQSPGEVLSPEQFAAFLQKLREHYDFVFLEAAALNDYSDAHELVPFADKVIAVFNARSVLRTPDKESIQFLQGLDERFAGAILTAVDARAL